MITLNDKLGYQVDAELARMRKANDLDAIQYRQLHSETVARFASNEPDALSSALQAVYDKVEAVYTRAKIVPEVAPDGILIDRDTLIRTVAVLQRELKAGRIDLEEFNQLNTQRRGYFYLVSVGNCAIPRDMPIAQYYLEAEKLAPKSTVKPVVTKTYETDKAKVNSSKASTTKSELKPTSIQPIVKQEREADLLDSPLEVLLSEDDKTKSGTKLKSTVTKDTNGSTDGSTDGSTKGITFDKNRHKWMFKAKVEGRRTTIGRYSSKAEAIAAKQDWEQQH